MKNKNSLSKSQTFSVPLFCEGRKVYFKILHKSFLAILILFGWFFIFSLKLSAQENFTGCDKPEARKDLPFPIDRVKQMCKKDLDNKKKVGIRPDFL